jgi:CTP-dependent riboflavin kinase
MSDSINVVDDINNLKKDVAECQKTHEQIIKLLSDIELIKKDILELKQKQSDDRLDLLTKEVQELKEILKTVLK